MLCLVTMLPITICRIEFKKKIITELLLKKFYIAATWFSENAAKAAVCR